MKAILGEVRSMSLFLCTSTLVPSLLYFTYVLVHLQLAFRLHAITLQFPYGHWFHLLVQFGDFRRRTKADAFNRRGSWSSNICLQSHYAHHESVRTKRKSISSIVLTFLLHWLVINETKKQATIEISGIDNWNNNWPRWKDRDRQFRTWNFWWVVMDMMEASI